MDKERQLIIDSINNIVNPSMFTKYYFNDLFANCLETYNLDLLYPVVLKTTSKALSCIADSKFYILSIEENVQILYSDSFIIENRINIKAHYIGLHCASTYFDYSQILQNLFFDIKITSYSYTENVKKLKHIQSLMENMPKNINKFLRLGIPPNALCDFFINRKCAKSISILV